MKIMTRTEIKKKIKECLQKFDGVDSPDDMVSETLFNIYGQEMNEICRLFESEFRKLHQPTVISSVCDCENLPKGEIAVSTKALTDPNWTGTTN